MKKIDKLVLEKHKLRNKAIKNLNKLIKKYTKLNKQMIDSTLYENGYNNLALENIWYLIQTLVISLCLTAGYIPVELSDTSYLDYSNNFYTEKLVNKVVNYWNKNYKKTYKKIANGDW